MADFLFNFVTSTAQSLAGETGFITANGGVIVDGSDAITTTTGSNAITNDGYIYSYNGFFSAIDSNGTALDLTNGKNGIITARDTSAGVIDADLSSILSVTNHGIIQANAGDAINMEASDDGAIFELFNTGEITSQSTALDLHVGTSYAYITNSGTLSSRSVTVDLDSDAANGSYHVLINTGLITSFESNAVDVALGDTGTFFMSNSGTITSRTNAIAVASSRTTDVILDNSGLIESLGLRDGVDLGGGHDVVTNTGTILGDVDLRDGNDTFDGRGGSVSGEVDGGDGDDTYIIDDATIELLESSGGGTDTVETTVSYMLESNFENLELIGGDNISGAGNVDANTLNGNSGDNGLYGLGGDDIIYGGAGDDMIRGGRSNDTLYGDEGDDFIMGGTGNDRLFGGDGNDVLEGRRGDDRIFGSEGSDIMIGAQGNDRLTGGNGNDVLIGGLGKDVLIGGDGVDTFVWNTAAESTNSADADQITDFEIGIDQLDFNGAMQGAFDVSIAGLLTGGGTASLVAIEFGGNTEIYADIDGDAVADMRVILTGTTGISDVDFLI